MKIGQTTTTIRRQLRVIENDLRQFNPSAAYDHLEELQGEVDRLRDQINVVQAANWRTAAQS